MSDIGKVSSDGKPCRACTDFKKWMKIGPSKPTEEKASPKETDRHSKEDSSQSKTHIPPAQSKVEESVDQSVLDVQQGICPPDRGELGSATWTFLHSVAAYFPSSPSPAQQDDAKKLVEIVSRLYPCEECADDLKVDLKVEPPVVASAEEFSQWMCRLHNRVNVKLGKPTFDCTKVFERWRDGWKDGSCD